MHISGEDAAGGGVTMTTDTRRDDGTVDATQRRRLEFAEEFGLNWEQSGGTRMEGRVIGYLMVTPEPYLSLADLAATLSASAGSVSTTTRRLLETGFIKRHVIPGDRSYYYRADDDIWGSWLAGERRYLRRMQEIFERQLAVLGSGEDDEGARRRLSNGRDYMSWIVSQHQQMLADWERVKTERDARAAGGDHDQH
jgi:DNA-binding transcriptional regulator GbsR (MarR family)